MAVNRDVIARRNPYFSLLVAGVTVTVGTEATNAINVVVQLNNRFNKPQLNQGAVHAYLSDNADGSTIAASAPSSGWAIGTDGLLIPIVANKAAMFVAKGTTGKFDVTITEVTAKTFYLVIILPSGATVITPVAFA